MSRITEEQFEEQYSPSQNHLNSSSASLSGIMYETFGKEIEFINEVVNNPNQSNKVWTVVQKRNSIFINSGFDPKEAIGYVITENGWNEKNIQVRIGMEQ